MKHPPTVPEVAERPHNEAPSVSLSRLSALGVTPAADESVAIVQQLIANADRETDDPGVILPSLDQVFITGNGQVISGGGDGALSIFAIARLLEQLLPEPGRRGVPGGLRYVIARALGRAEAHPFQSLDELSSALMLFESGDRVEIVRDLFARAGSPAPDIVDRPFTALEQRSGPLPGDAPGRLFHDPDREAFDRPRLSSTPPASATPDSAPAALRTAGQSRQTAWSSADMAALVITMSIGLGLVWLGLHMSRTAAAPVGSYSGFQSGCDAAVPDDLATPTDQGELRRDSIGADFRGWRCSRASPSHDRPESQAQFTARLGTSSITGRPIPARHAGEGLSGQPRQRCHRSRRSNGPRRVLQFGIKPGIEEARRLASTTASCLPILQQCVGK